MTSSSTTTTYKIRYNARTALYRKLFFMMWNALNGPWMGRARNTWSRARAHTITTFTNYRGKLCARCTQTTFAAMHSATTPRTIIFGVNTTVCIGQMESWARVFVTVAKTDRLAHDLCVKFALSTVYFEFYCRFARAGYLFSALTPLSTHRRALRISYFYFWPVVAVATTPVSSSILMNAIFVFCVWIDRWW